MVFNNVETLRDRLEEQLLNTYGDDISVDQIKMIFHFRSISAAIAAINEQHLAFREDISPFLSNKTFPAAAVANYIAEEYMKSVKLTESKTRRGEKME